MIAGACRRESEVFIVISGDSDLVDPIARVRGHGILVVVVNPAAHRPNGRLLGAATYYMTLPPHLLEQSLLPSRVRNEHGREYTRQGRW